MKPIKLDKYKGDFFRVLSETKLSQIAVMTLKANGKSGEEGQHNGDQTVYVIEGKGEVILLEKDELYPISKGEIFTIPAKEKHRVVNTGREDLFVLCLYAPPAY